MARDIRTRRLLLLSRAIWVRLFGVSFLVHAGLVVLLLFLLFGGQQGEGGTTQDSLVIAAGRDAPDLDLDAQTEPIIEESINDSDDTLDMSGVLEMPMDTAFDNLKLDSAAPTALAPTLPKPTRSTIERVAGAGLIDGAPQSFADYIQHLRSSGLDVVFVIDATGSMVWVHRLVRARIDKLANFVRSLVPLTRFGIIAYRDHDDPDFVVHISQPSFDIDRARKFMTRIDAIGGGDIPEAVTTALQAAQDKIEWRKGAQRVVIVIGDAPPHPENLETALALAARMKAQAVRLSLVDSRVQANRALLKRRVAGGDLSTQAVLPSFRRLALAAGGQAITLSAERQLMRHLALLIFDKKFRKELAPLVANLE